MIPDAFFDYFTLVVTCWAITTTFLVLHVMVQRDDARRAVADARAWIRGHRCGTIPISCDESDPTVVTWTRRNGRGRQW